jgi:hypothetical protein
MNVKNPNLVIVRGINSEHFVDNFKDLCISFGGSPQAIPKEDSYYVGLYLEAPISAITHIGIVDSIERYDNGGVDFYLKAIIELKNPVNPGHAIRKHENWALGDFELSTNQMENLRNQLSLI